jgi:hypothetical protein
MEELAAKAHDSTRRKQKRHTPLEITNRLCEAGGGNAP